MHRVDAAKRALVTGAGGFVGGHLARALLDAGWWVRALEHRRACEPADERLRGDVRDPTTRAGAVRGVSCVFHCAAWIEGDDEREATAINRAATIALAESARNAGARCFVFVSTQAAIGSPPGSGPVDERVECAPETAYGRSKRAAERDLLALDRASMRVVIVRPPLVYGPGEHRSFLRLTRAVASGLFPLIGGGHNRASFCHVENLTAAMLFVAENEAAHGVLHVADRHPVTMREAVGTIASAVGARPLPFPVPERAAWLVARAAELAFAPTGARAPLDRARLAALTRDRPLDTSALAALGFVPPIEFGEGVLETIARYRGDGVLDAR